MIFNLTEHICIWFLASNKITPYFKLTVVAENSRKNIYEGNV